MEFEKDFTFRSSGLASRSYNFFEDAKRKKEFCDITFRVGNHSISAHRIIIAAAIPYFRDVLSNKIAPREEQDIVLADIDPTVLECLLDFAYSCEVVINEENVKNILNGACFLHIEEVREACCDFLIDRLRPETVLNIRVFACDIKCPELLEHTDYYIRENFAEISQLEEWLNLPFSYVKELLAKDDLRVFSEESVFEAVLKWVKKCPEDRKVDLSELLKTVRMPLLSPLYLKNSVSKEELIRSCISCRDLLDEAREFHFFPEERTGSCSFSSKPRRSTECYPESATAREVRIYALFQKCTYTAKYIGHSADTWKTKNCPVFHCKGASSAEVYNTIYFFRGSDVKAYDSLSSTLKNRSRMPTGRSFTVSIPLYNKIYVCGGLNGDLTTASRTVECYDVLRNRWTTMNPLRVCRGRPGGVGLKGCIYVFGGRQGKRVHKSMEKYDFRSKKWRPAPSMLTERHSLASTTLNGRVYACGGKTSDSQCTATGEVYDPVKNEWKFISPMNTARCSFVLRPYCGKLFAFGGEDDLGNSVNTVEIYDPETDQWEFGRALDCKEFVTCGGVISIPVTSAN